MFNDGAACEPLTGRCSQLVGARFPDWRNLPQGLNWLDVGCGNGAFTEVLAPLFRALQALGHPGGMPPASDISRMEPLKARWRGAAP